MLTRSLINKAQKHPELTICRFCNKPVDPLSEEAEYIKSRVNEQFFHRSCFVKTYRESINKC